MKRILMIRAAGTAFSQNLEHLRVEYPEATFDVLITDDPLLNAELVERDINGRIYRLDQGGRFHAEALKGKLLKKLRDQNYDLIVVLFKNDLWRYRNVVELARKICGQQIEAMDLQGNRYSCGRLTLALEGFKSRWRRWRSRRRKRVTVRLGGHSCRLNTEHPWMKNWVNSTGAEVSPHESGGLLQMMEHAGEDTVFYDVGANRGFFSVFLAGLCPEGEICAFEMDPELIGIIKSQFEANPELTNYRIFCGALGDQSGNPVSFSTHGRAGRSKSFNQMRGAEQPEGTVQVSTITLDDYARETGLYPDLVKIDVEGAEGRVLAGMSELLKTHSPTLFMELHAPKLLATFDDNPETVLQFLRDHNYELQVISGHRLGPDQAKLIPLSDHDLTGNDMIFAQPHPK